MADGAQQTITGAEAIIGSLAESGVRVCFANPGTSEMHLVTALDREARIRSVLCLFEGVATGAADGYARIAETPAVTLLHLGPGYLNGGANIHNARRAYSPMICLVGDHAVSHRKLDAPLASDIAGLARPNSHWIKSADQAKDAGRLAVEAWLASFGPPAGPVTLIMPADAAWTKGGEVFRPPARPQRAKASNGVIEDAARAIHKAKAPAILVNSAAASEAGLAALAKLEAKGVRVFLDTFVARQARGGGRFSPQRLSYFAEAAIKDFGSSDLLLVAGTKPPVAFFAYPNTPGELSPPGASVFSLGGPEIDGADAVAKLAEALGPVAPPPAMVGKPPAPDDKFNPWTIGLCLARRLPENAIVADDGVTAGLPIYLATQQAARHDWLSLTGGAIGWGMPAAIGAAIARPEAKTICLSGDGAGMYTVQSLWTMARENLDILTIVFVNNAYRILRIELARTGAGDPGPAASSMLDLGRPDLDWEKIAQGMGVPAETATTVAEFDAALARAMSVKGPWLIAAVTPAA